MQQRRVIIFGLKTDPLDEVFVNDLNEETPTPFSCHDNKVEVEGITVLNFHSRYDQELGDASFIPLSYHEFPEESSLMSRAIYRPRRWKPVLATLQNS